MDQGTRMQAAPGSHNGTASSQNSRSSSPDGRARAAWTPEVKELISAAPAVVFLAHDPECRRITGSRAAYELLRRPVDSSLFESAPTEEPVPRFTCVREGRELAFEELPIRQAARGIEVRGMELRVLFHDGTTKHLYGGAIPLLDEHNCPQGALAAFVEVTELRQAQESLNAQIQELTRLNAELEQLALIIHHDLRSPLMTLSGYTQLLANEREGLSDTGREMVSYIQDSVRHLVRMVAGLLQYSRLGTGPLNTASCPVEQVLAAVLRSLQAALDRTGTVVTHDSLPIVRADPALLEHVFQNLIENAIKYRNEAAPRVHVCCRKKEGEYVFSIHDNGIGIDPRHAERVFQLFQRLHADESQYGGLGIGLTISRKIVERHGGQIWVESRVGQGATLSFTLPAGDPGSKVTGSVSKASDCGSSGEVPCTDHTTQPNRD